MPELSNKLVTKYYTVEQCFDELRNEGTESQLTSLYLIVTFKKLSAENFQSESTEINVAWFN
ncbi:hypothetical protein HYE30_00895 [Mycoplasmopsis bovis]|nr:hypothetical protein [Mycoplasmopsis bovis]QQH22454.1 hypothetical protein HYE30_00895 [Mycoplasmopsis bovis]